MGNALDTIKRFYESFNASDFDDISKLVKPDVRSYEPSTGLMEDEAAWRAHGEAFKAAMPDARLLLDSALEAGNTVAVQGRFTGTHTAPLVGPQGEVPPTGNRIELHFADFFTLEDGLIAEHRVYYDQLEMLGQLGLAPAPA